jgi:hypothetical protein
VLSFPLAAATRDSNFLNQELLLASAMVFLDSILFHALPADEAFALALREQSYNVVIAATFILAALTLYSIYAKPRKEKIKKMLFAGIVIVSVLSTLFLAATTVYVNFVSPTGGPVHWHTDYEIWNCGEKMDLVDPTGIDNRVGTWEVHEHNDDRMHVEGTIVDLDQKTFRHFFETVGSVFTPQEFIFITNAGNTNIPYRGTCNGKPAELQAFLLRVTNPQDAKRWEFSQEKIPISLDTAMQPYSNVPPGDCLIIEFDETKDTTTHSCASYRAAMNRGELHGR